MKYNIGLFHLMMLTILGISQVETTFAAVQSTQSTSTVQTKKQNKVKQPKKLGKLNNTQQIDLKNEEQSNVEQNNKVATTSTTVTQIPTNQSKITVKSIAQPEQKNWAVDLSTSATTNLYKVDPASSYEQFGYQFGFHYKFDFAQFSLMTEYNQDLKYSEASDISDLITSLSKKFKLNDSQQLGFSATAMLPTSKASRMMNQLQLGTGGKVSWSHISGVSLSVSLTRMFHQYETNINGRVLSKLSSKQAISYATEFGKFGVSLFFAHINGLTYFDQLKESWEHGQEISYSFTDQTGISLGHYNTGSPYKPNGYDSNYSLFNEQTSSVYISLATGI